ncbi:MAG: cytochrome c [Gammaproteobacteria bacterium]|nr:cytochrome c [Gammaproteobacteria bacterium]
MIYKLTGLLLMVALIAGCSEEPSAKSMQPPERKQMVMEEIIPVRNMDFSQIARGGQIFNKNCAECHGPAGQGADNWRQKGSDGRFPAPPLNGTGHAWHHPYAQLKQAIKDGTVNAGGSMPAWREKLSEQDIEDVMAWFMSKWPDELYTAWYKNNEKSKRTGS